MSARECDVQATAEERRLRKRIQNRLHQRAFRARHQNENNSATGQRTKKRHQYQVNRWRLDEELAKSTRSPRGGAPSSDQDQLCPLPQDHRLLHLVKWNVFRALSQNKRVLGQLTTQYRLSENLSPQTEAFGYYATTNFPNYSVIIPVTPSTPVDSLAPTASQMTIVHSSWINFLPFPQMRENLIKFEFDFDHAELIRDLVGNLINLNLFLSKPPSPGLNTARVSGQTALEGGDADVDSSQSGLIVWGEPYLVESWEATPEFLRKWAWAVAGCQELIDATNRWRRARGEDPVQLALSI
ncbi:DUF3425 domain-containing protein [Aspergillus lucknowensis]|uniref:BZIP domain-containing protein n=1 Tax=Aspergillus lucknowensis TaxID=176173 RepID=A0ABR4LY29_9EURO